MRRCGEATEFGEGKIWSLKLGGSALKNLLKNKLSDLVKLEGEPFFFVVSSKFRHQKSRRFLLLKNLLKKGLKALKKLLLKILFRLSFLFFYIWACSGAKNTRRKNFFFFIEISWDAVFLSGRWPPTSFGTFFFIFCFHPFFVENRQNQGKSSWNPKFLKFWIFLFSLVLCFFWFERFVCFPQKL